MVTRSKAIISLIIVSAIWGVASVAIVYTLKYISPISFLYIRFLIPAFILYFFVHKELKNLLHSVSLLKLTKNIFNHKKNILFIKEELQGIKKIKSIFLVGVLGSTINLGLLFYAFKYTSAIEGTIIYATAPIWVFIVSAFLLKERITKKELTGLFITIFGFLIIVLHPIFENGTTLSNNLYGNFIMVLATASWVAYSILSKKIYNHGHKYSPQLITFITFFSGAVTLFPFAIYEIFTTPINLSAALPGILYMAIFSSVIAYWLFEYGVKHIEVSEASIFQYIQPLFTIPVAMWLLNEPFSIWYFFGGIITAYGIYIAEQRRK